MHILLWRRSNSKADFHGGNYARRLQSFHKYFYQNNDSVRMVQEAEGEYKAFLQ